MNRSALGLVETYGYIGAVEALDVCLKSANVEAVGCEFVRGGIVTIEITGDVAAVKAAIEAAEAAVNKIGSLRTTHVIARTSEDVWKMIEKENDEVKSLVDSKECKNTDLSNEEQIKSEEIIIPKNEEGIYENKCEKVSEANIVEVEEDSYREQKKLASTEVKTRAELEDMKVQELRTLARTMKLTTLTKKQIKFGKKDQLVNAIIRFYDRR